MKLEQQVCSLELAQKLKELGVKQESEFSCYETTDRDDTPRLNWSDENRLTLPQQPWEEKYSAFTVAELGEMLPKSYTSGQTSFEESEKRYCCSWYEGYNKDSKPVYAETEADARAKMLIYLLENKLIVPN